MPELSKVTDQIEDIWAAKRLTNNGSKYKELEAKIQKELKVKNASLFNNGTIALLTALKTMDLKTDISIISKITSPFIRSVYFSVLTIFSTSFSIKLLPAN